MRVQKILRDCVVDINCAPSLLKHALPPGASIACTRIKKTQVLLVENENPDQTQCFVSPCLGHCELKMLHNFIRDKLAINIASVAKNTEMEPDGRCCLPFNPSTREAGAGRSL